MTTPIY